MFAAWQGSVFPGNFDTTLLITIYAIIVLGGLGSLPGVLLGALIIIAVPDILRNADLAGKLFYLGALVTLAERPQTALANAARCWSRCCSSAWSCARLCSPLAPDAFAPLAADQFGLHRRHTQLADRSDRCRCRRAISPSALLIVLVLAVSRIKNAAAGASSR